MLPIPKFVYDIGMTVVDLGTSYFILTLSTLDDFVHIKEHEECYVDQAQSDQIWQNFATLAKFYNYLAIFFRFG